MTYGEWLEKEPEDAAKVTKIQSFGANIYKDGKLDIEKIKSMPILMISYSEDKVEVTVC